MRQLERVIIYSLFTFILGWLYLLHSEVIDHFYALEVLFKGLFTLGK